jgi:serine/threonine protein kinase
MPLEQKGGSKKVQTSSDIYAMGVILYELILGRVSFGRIDLELIPKHLREIVKKATQTDPNGRYEDVMEMIADLSVYLKKGLLAQEESSEDTLKDLLESIEQSKRLLIAPIPEGLMDLSVELALNPQPNGANYAVLHHILPDGSYLALIASCRETDMQSLLELKTVMERGKLLLEWMTVKNEFSLSKFLERLENGACYILHLQLLHVSTTENLFHLFSFGNASIAHHSYTSSTLRTLEATGRLFGNSGPFPNPIQDRLDSLDTIVIGIDGGKLELTKVSPDSFTKDIFQKNSIGNSSAALVIRRLD